MDVDKVTNVLREFDALKDYPAPKEPRIVGTRTVKHRILASQRGKDFFDGDRNCGYGGLKNDGRWAPIARNMCEEYQLGEHSSVLQLNCEKAFLLYELLKLHPLMRVRGTETSTYARDHATPGIRLGVRLEPPTRIPFDYKEFSLVIALGVVYTLNLADAITCLKEIERVGQRAFITLGAYDTEEDLKLFRQWSLLGCTILKKDEWKEVLTHCGYTGDYWFVSGHSLNLQAPFDYRGLTEGV